ncbi:MAG: sensor histidine kinase, partial [Spirochaetota bacterium]
FSICVFSSIFAKPTSQVEDGVLDLRQWDFQKIGRVNLRGNWNFYWKYFLVSCSKDTTCSSHLPQKTLAKVPNFWNDIQYQGKPIGNFGFASYHIKILLPKNLNSLGIKYTSINEAFALYANDKLLVKTGELGTNAKTSSGQIKPQVVSIPITDTSIDLVFEMSNYHDYHGGFPENIYLGTVDSLHSLRENNIILDFLLIGSLIMSGIYHLSLYFFGRRENYIFTFALFCFAASLYAISSEEILILKVFPNMSYNSIVKFAFFSDNTTGFLFTSLIHLSFREDSPRIPFYFIFTFFFIMSITSLCLPLYYVTQSIYGMDLAALSVIPYAIFVLFKAIYHKREGVILFSLGVLGIIITIINDVLYSVQISPYSFLVPLGILFFAVSQTQFLAQRLSKAFTKAENLSHKLQLVSQDLAFKNDKLVVLNERQKELNQTLEEKVQLRTNDLHKQKELAEKTNLLKDKFVTVLAHDIRSPLTAINTKTISLLQSSDTRLDSQEIRNFLSQQQDILQNVLDMTKSILNYNRFRTGNLSIHYEYVSMQEMLDFILDNLLKTFLRDKNIKIVHNLQEECILVSDKSLLQEVFLNILTNAIKYCHSEDHISIECREEKNSLYFAIKDTGPGIAADLLENIFQFQYTRTIYDHSSGFGLPITKEIVQMLQGRISIESEDSQGTVVHLYFPYNEVLVFCLSETIVKNLVNRPPLRQFLFSSLDSLIRTALRITPNFFILDPQHLQYQEVVDKINHHPELQSVPIRLTNETIDWLTYNSLECSG